MIIWISKTYCLECKKFTENKNPTISQTTYVRTMNSAHCVVCNSTKNKFIKEQPPQGLVSSLALRTPSSKFLMLSDILF